MAVTTFPCRGSPSVVARRGGHQQLSVGGIVPSYEVVTVNYMTRRYLARMLASLPDHVWVTVVDNSGREEQVDDLVLSRPRSRYLGMVRNVGFAQAANHGVAQTSSDAVIILNPACFPCPSVLDDLVS